MEVSGGSGVAGRFKVFQGALQERFKEFQKRFRQFHGVSRVSGMFPRVLRGFGSISEDLSEFQDVQTRLKVFQEVSDACHASSEYLIGVFYGVSRIFKVLQNRHLSKPLLSSKSGNF